MESDEAVRCNVVSTVLSGLMKINVRLAGKGDARALHQGTTATIRLDQSRTLYWR